MPYLQILQKYAYQGIFAYICNENSSKSYDFREKCRKIFCLEQNKICFLDGKEDK